MAEGFFQNVHTYSIFESEGDFLPQFFRATLVWYDGLSLNNLLNNTKTISFEDLATINSSGWFSTVKNSYLTKTGFIVRFGKLTIPSVRNETFDLKIGERTIRKLKSTKQMTRQLSFSFRLDDQLEWLNFLNRASGVYNDTSDRMAAKSYNEKMKLYIVLDCLDISESGLSVRKSYMLTNVKFLNSDAVNFSVDSSGSTDTNIQFIFKDLYQI